MRLWLRALLLFPAVLVLGVCSVLAGLAKVGGLPLPIWLLGWLMLGNALLFLGLRCPHCRRWAVVRPSGTVSPIVGHACRHCGTRY